MCLFSANSNSALSTASGSATVYDPTPPTILPAAHYRGFKTVQFDALVEAASAPPLTRFEELTRLVRLLCNMPIERRKIPFGTLISPRAARHKLPGLIKAVSFDLGRLSDPDGYVTAEYLPPMPLHVRWKMLACTLHDYTMQFHMFRQTKGKKRAEEEQPLWRPTPRMEWEDFEDIHYWYGGEEDSEWEIEWDESRGKVREWDEVEELVSEHSEEADGEL